MKKLICFLIVIAFCFSLSSCINVKNEELKNNANNSIDFHSTNDYTKQAIERIKEEETKKEEMWREEHLIATASTVFNPNEVERTNNIKLASKYINELVLNPNETFSFNEIVGERTLERGFLPADTYVVLNGEVITTQSPGGGICQVSTTICMAVNQTQMDIIERNLHSKAVNYATRENEAMINWGTSDFRFVNSYEFPVKLEILFVQVEGGEQITCNIFSI